MHYPNSSILPPAKKIDEFLSTTKTLLAQLRSLSHAWENNWPPRPFLTAESPATRRQRKEFVDSFKSYRDECARIVEQRREIRATIYQHFRPQVRDFLPDIEIDCPEARDCEKKHNELFDELLRDDSEAGVRVYLLGLDTLLRDIRKKLGDDAAIAQAVGEKHSDSSPLHRRPRGRPPLPYERKLEAWNLWKQRGDPKAVAAALYGTKHPTKSQRGSIYRVLGNFEKTRLGTDRVAELLEPTNSN